MEDSEARAVLGIGTGATIADAKAAHRRLLKLVHPDRVSDLEAEQQATATETTVRLNLALETLRAADSSPSDAPGSGYQRRQEPGGGSRESPRQEPSPAPPPRPRAADSPARSPSPPSPSPAPGPSGRRAWPLVAAIATVVVAGGIYLLNLPSTSSTPVSAPVPTVTSAPNIDTTPTLDAATAPAAAPSPIVTPTKASPSPKPTATPKPRNWVPTGFEKWDDQLAFRWDNDVTCPAGTPYGCWGVTVVSRDGCRYMEYLLLEILDSAGQMAGNTYELKGQQRAGAKTHYVLPNLSFMGVGREAQIGQLTCS